MLFALLSCLCFGNIVPAGYTPGLNYEVYNGEILFSRLSEQKIIPDGNVGEFKLLYKGIIVHGSFNPQVTGKYKFRVRGKSYIQFQVTVDGTVHTYPNSLGPAGSCWYSISDDKSSDEFTLYAGKLYPFKLWLRTGCNLYTQWLYIQTSKDGGDWEYTQDWVTSDVETCYPGYYGQNCQNQCTIDCNNHGHCDEGPQGTGKCICDEGFLPPNCEDKTPFVPPNCSKGAHWVTYGDEIWFARITEDKTVAQINYTNLDLTYKAVVVSGSILVPISGDYQFRIVGKPYGQLTIAGKSYPSSLGPAGSCLGVFIDDYATDTIFMYANQTVPFTIKYRAGCGLYSKRLELYWKNGPQWGGDLPRAPWEFLPANTLYQCDHQECVPGMYGEDCKGICPECPEHSKCFDGLLGNGTCLCDQGFFGEKCDDACSKNADCGEYASCYQGKCYCNDGYYGSHCETKCTASETCGGHGVCNHEGKCDCDDGFYGSDCRRTTPYIPPSADCDHGVTYTRFKNEITFEGVAEGPETKPNVDILVGGVTYNSAIVTGSVIINDTKSVQFKIIGKPVGQLAINGQTVPHSIGTAGRCDAGQTEEATTYMTLLGHKYYPFQINYRSGCMLYTQRIQLYWRFEGENDFHLVPNENLRVCTDRQCLDRYSGQNCTDYCNLDCGDHGNCYQDEVNKQTMCMCEENYYGHDCRTFCDPKTSCGEHGQCSLDGKCECQAGYSGPNCTLEQYASLSGDSISCPQSANLLWHTDENFGTVKKRNIVNSASVEIDSKTDYQSITISGSLSAPTTGLYRFRAQGKPTVHLSILPDWTIANPDFPSGVCDNRTEIAETNPKEMTAHKLYPFVLQYRSGCGNFNKELKLMYQRADKNGSFVDCLWQVVPATMLRSCSAYQCELGYFGNACNNFCGDCGDNGVCVDGIDGDGKCLCNDWYIGESCQYNTFTLAMLTFAIFFILSIIWVCWPSKLKEEAYDDDLESMREPGESLTTISDLRSSLLDSRTAD